MDIRKCLWYLAIVQLFVICVVGDNVSEENAAIEEVYVEEEVQDGSDDDVLVKCYETVIVFVFVDSNGKIIEHHREEKKDVENVENRGLENIQEEDEGDSLNYVKYYGNTEGLEDKYEGENIDAENADLSDTNAEEYVDDDASAELYLEKEVPETVPIKKLSVKKTKLSVAKSSKSGSMAQNMIFKCVKPKTVALTFDDGPSFPTMAAIKALKKQGVKAAFFFLGQNIAEGNEKIVRKAYEEGHLIASHTWSHEDLTTLSNKDIKKQMKDTSNIIESIIGKKPVYMRPPYGRVDDHVLKQLAKDGYKVVMWNIDTHDWEKSKKENPKLITEAFKKEFKRGIAKGEKSFISLQHDLHRGSADQIEHIISFVKDQGYKIVSLPECMGDKHPYR